MYRTNGNHANRHLDHWWLLPAKHLELDGERTFQQRVPAQTCPAMRPSRYPSVIVTDGVSVRGPGHATGGEFSRRKV